MRLYTFQIPDFDWDSGTQGLILASFFYGYIITQIPGGYFATKYGGKRIFLFGITTTAVLTLLTPALAKTHTSLLIAVRVISGLCEGVSYPSIHAIWSRWAPPLEQSRITAFAFSGDYFLNYTSLFPAEPKFVIYCSLIAFPGMYMGTVIAMPLAGILAQYVSWEAIFYVFGKEHRTLLITFCSHLVLSQDCWLCSGACCGGSVWRTRPIRTGRSRTRSWSTSRTPSG